MNLTHLFDLSLVGRRDEPGLETDVDARARTFAFGELEARANRMAAALAARGARRGDRLAIYLPNRLEYIDLWLACTRLGVIAVPVNILYKEREIRHIAGDARPVAIVTAAPEAEGLPEGLAVWPVDDLVREMSTRSPEREAADGPVLDGDAPAAIVYTSGTTGASKGAVLTHNNLAANALNVTGCWGITSADRYLAVLPLFHVHGLGNGVHGWLASGCLMRLVERFDHRIAGALFREFRPTLFFGVPTVYVRLLDLPPDEARAIGERMRLFVCGSAPLPAPTLEAFRALYGHTILERYGMTETLMIATNPYAGERRAGSVGLPFPGVSLRVAGGDGRPVADGEVGEVQVRGPTLFAEYWGRPEATAAAWSDGWFRTGDVGVRTADGYLTLRGRKSDLIISGGFNIYPREIEELLLEQPGVREAAVVAVPDAVRGEVPVAYLVLDDAMEAGDALAEVCRRSLASFKVPRAFVRVDALPRTALGKVQKHLLPRPGLPRPDLPAPGAGGGA